MADDKQSRTAKPESLEAKFKLLALLPYDRRAKRKHCLVFGFILDWYHSKYGDALASVRHVTSTIKERDPAGAGIGMRHVQEALTDLVAWGYLEQEKGIGRRASRYIPVWAKLDSVSPVGNATDSEISVSPVGNTSVSPVGNTTGISVPPVGNEDPSTVTRPQDGVNGIDGYEPAAPTAPPPPPANAADGAGTAGDETKATTTSATTTTKTGFDELWNAYGYKRGKPEARRAYAKLAPDADLHAAMVASAIDWQKTWAAQDKPDAPRFTLTKWIEREEYECTPPTAYKAKERKKPTAANDDKPARGKGKWTEQLRLIETEFIGSPFGDYRVRIKLDGPSGEQEHVLRVLLDNGVGPDNEAFNKLQRAFGSNADKWPGQRLRLEMDGGRVVDIVPERKPDRQVEIAEADLRDMGDEKLIVLKFTDAGGNPEGVRDIVFEADDEYAQKKGRDELVELLSAVGLATLADTDELVGQRLMLTASDRFKIVEEAA